MDLPFPFPPGVVDGPFPGEIAFKISSSLHLDEVCSNTQCTSHRISPGTDFVASSAGTAALSSDFVAGGG